MTLVFIKYQKEDVTMNTKFLRIRTLPKSIRVVKVEYLQDTNLEAIPAIIKTIQEEYGEYGALTLESCFPIVFVEGGWLNGAPALGALLDPTRRDNITCLVTPKSWEQRAKN